MIAQLQQTRAAPSAAIARRSRAVVCQAAAPRTEAPAKKAVALAAVAGFVAAALVSAAPVQAAEVKQVVCASNPTAKLCLKNSFVKK